MCTSDEINRPHFINAKEMYKSHFMGLGFNLECLHDSHMITPISTSISSKVSSSIVPISEFERLAIKRDNDVTDISDISKNTKKDDNTEKVNEVLLHESNSIIEVFLKSSARCLENIRGKTNMKYHMNENCRYINADTGIHRVTLSEAESFNHTKCDKCIS